MLFTHTITAEKAVIYDSYPASLGAAAFHGVSLGSSLSSTLTSY